MTNKAMGQTGRLLLEEPFMEMFADFQNWRVDDFIRQIESERRRGRILPFVRGLRLSAQLIYLLRDLLSGSGITANWGHLLDDEMKFCSCECDVIIHKNGHVRRWDGSREPVMDFKFIKKDQAIAVISCKSYTRTGDVDKDYCESMKEFVDRVWLFSECCGPKSIERIRNKAIECGYEKFWPLYTWAKQKGPTPSKREWLDFVNEVEKLRESAGN